MTGIKKQPSSIKTTLIAPCGMNCALCTKMFREKNTCPGCNIDDVNKPNYCQVCIIKNCDKRKSKRFPYCFNCDSYPCKRLKQLDKRYRTKYGMSMLENLDYIKESGIRQFIKMERERRTCKKCGGLICIHKENCLSCGEKIR